MVTYTQQQTQAISTIDQNLQIIACAGSGKTQVISQRIVEILRSRDDITPGNIVAFTYTEKAAAELKSRVLKLCKEQLDEPKGMVEMYIGTIHSWCLQVLQTWIYEYQKFSVLDEVKLKLFIDRNYFPNTSTGSDIGMRELDMSIYVDTRHFFE